MVDQTVNCGDEHGVIWKDSIPVCKGLIGGDQHGTSFVTCADQLEQDRGLGVILVYLGQIIKDQQMVFVEFGDGCFKLKGLAGLLQLLHEICSAAEQHAKAILDQCAADG